MREPQMGWAERLAALRALPGWLELAAADLGMLASIATPRVAEDGQRLVEPGRPLHSVLVVADGELVVRRPGREPRRVRTREVAGAIAAFAHDPQGIECVSAGSSSVLELPLEDLEDLMEERLSVLMRWLREVSRACLAHEKSGAPDLSEPPRASAPLAPFGLVERISLLRGTRAFGTAHIDGLASLARAAREVRLEPGEVLYRAGDAAEDIAVVAAGTISALRPDGRRSVLSPYDVAGVLETFGEERRSFDAVADTPATVLLLDRDEMLDVWEDHPDAGIELLRSLCAQLLRSPGNWA
jgi:CRP-like cAMP-binding protein